jgi:hypothetical protein
LLGGWQSVFKRERKVVGAMLGLCHLSLCSYPGCVLGTQPNVTHKPRFRRMWGLQQCDPRAMEQEGSIATVSRTVPQGLLWAENSCSPSQIVFTATAGSSPKTLLQIREIKHRGIEWLSQDSTTRRGLKEPHVCFLLVTHFYHWVRTRKHPSKKEVEAGRISEAEVEFRTSWYGGHSYHFWMGVSRECHVTWRAVIYWEQKNTPYLSVWKPMNYEEAK